jgi:hypothetical protein
MHAELGLDARHGRGCCRGDQLYAPSAPRRAQRQTVALTCYVALSTRYVCIFDLSQRRLLLSVQVQGVA